MPTRVVGFTLLELLVVLAIAGLVMAITPPLIAQAIPGVQLKAASRGVASALREARNKAIGESRAQRLAIDLESRRYWVERGRAAGDIPEPIEIELTVAESQRDGDDRGAVAFFPDGSSTGGRITLARGDVRYEVTVDWLTGRVAVVD